MLGSFRLTFDEEDWTLTIETEADWNEPKSFHESATPTADVIPKRRVVFSTLEDCVSSEISMPIDSKKVEGPSTPDEQSFFYRYFTFNIFEQ